MSVDRELLEILWKNTSLQRRKKQNPIDGDGSSESENGKLGYLARVVLSVAS